MVHQVPCEKAISKMMPMLTETKPKSAVIGAHEKESALLEALVFSVAFDFDQIQADQIALQIRLPQWD